jgi:hypothetical protein
VFLDKDRTMDNVQQHNICTKEDEGKEEEKEGDGKKERERRTRRRAFLDR